MRVFDVKSILLGIGIGIIFTSIICMIYLMGIKPEKLSEAEIKKLAKQYGMVEGNSIYSEQKASNKSSESVETTD